MKHQQSSLRRKPYDVISIFLLEHMTTTLNLDRADNSSNSIDGNENQSRKNIEHEEPQHHPQTRATT